MNIVADSSPLIALAKIGQIDLLEKLFGGIVIAGEVYTEVVVIGAGLPGAEETRKASWIEVQPITGHANLLAAHSRFSLDMGELSTLVLAKEIRADLVLVDDLGARKLMRAEGFRIQGTIGILEASFFRKYLADLRQAYMQLLAKGVYLDRAFLDSRLKVLNLPPL